MKKTVDSDSKLVVDTEKRLREVDQAERARRWLEENRPGFEAFERYVERNGVFNENDREW